MSDNAAIALVGGMTIWLLASVGAAADGGRRWGWRWGLGLWLLWPIAIFAWAIRRHREKKADRATGTKRPVGV
jgi:hypothetical protein